MRAEAHPYEGDIPADDQNKSQQLHARSGGNGNGNGADGLDQALKALNKAVASGSIDTICAAYNRLREAGQGMLVRELFAAAAQACGRPVETAVLDAYTHLHCYMCHRGFAECENCEGSGVSESGKPCGYCEGLGGTACIFCQGTGWASQEMIPQELHKAVQQRQLAATCEEFTHVKTMLAHATPDQARALDAKQRRKLTQRLMRLQARLDDLFEREADDSLRHKLAQASELLGPYIRLLRDSLEKS